MLKAVQPIARAFDPGRARADQSWAGREREWLAAERRRVGQLAALCDTFLSQPELDPKQPLDVLCARQVRLADESLREALDELSERLAGLDPGGEAAAVERLCSGYLARVRTDGQRIFAELRTEITSLARAGDRVTQSALEAATGLPAETLLALMTDRDKRRQAESESAAGQAFSELHERYGKVVLGFIRARVDDDDDVQDLAQESWLRVWEKLPTYDPVRGAFHAFARYWASNMVLRYYDRIKAGRAAGVLASQLVRRFPSLLEEEGLGAVLDRLAARQLVEMEPADYAELYSELLRLTFGSGSPPHQLVAFGFSKIGGWTPGRIDAELAAIALRELEARLEHDYLDNSQLPAELVEPAFAPLRESMVRRFDAAVSDPKTQTTYHQLQARIVGTTSFQDYYTSSSPSADISHWWEAVRRRVREEVQRAGAGPLFELHRKAQRRAARKGPVARIAGGDPGDA